jgi:ribonuclease BN (tRNA processing enzyme)
MIHGYKNYAICIEKDSKKFVYSGDTCMNDKLVEFAKDADLFICEAGLLERDQKCIRAMHLTAREAAQIAEDAGVKRLLLTHFLPDVKLNRYIDEATQVYNGIMEMAGDNKSYFI